MILTDNLPLLLMSLLYILLLSPGLTYLAHTWAVRRNEILSGLSSVERNAISEYFDQFHPDFMPGQTDQKRRFKRYYIMQFGRAHFIFPLMLLVLIAAVLLYQCNTWTQDLLKGTTSSETPKIALFAILGAYMWVLYDQIRSWWRSDLSPGDFWWASFRFALAVPMGYAVSALASKEMGMLLAFTLGAFPTNTLFSYLRKIGRKTLKVDDSSDGATSELQKLQCIDSAKAERFEEEGITTVCQLAYSDPIRLTILTNLGYSYIVDCMSQALLWIYTEDRIKVYRNSALRGGYEVEELWKRLNGNNEKERTEADQLIKGLANELKSDEMKVRNVLREVATDPYTRFIYTSWSGQPC
jgi:hypothetical protein